jgi:transcriptional regulator with XRE-family HTH domain
MPDRPLHEKLADLRKKRFASQSALARAMGVTPGFINRVERSGRGLSYKNLLKWCELTGADTDLVRELAAELPDEQSGLLPEEEALIARLTRAFKASREDKMARQWLTGGLDSALTGAERALGLEPMAPDQPAPAAPRPSRSAKG